MNRWVGQTLTLYWALVTDGFANRRFRDGFREVDGVLEWFDIPGQGLLYLHGALHLFQHQGRLEKIRYQRSGSLQTLIEQIVYRIAQGHAPLFVCEGTSEQKQLQIAGNRYLRYCHRELSKLDTSLFIFGHSLGPADKHILNAISASGIQHVFVSLYGDPQNDHNQAIIRAADTPKSERSWRQIEVHFYNADSVIIW